MSEIVPPVSDVPSAPTALVVTAVETRLVILAWTPDCEDDCAYRVERAIGAGAEGAYRCVGRTGRRVTVYADADVAPGTTYRYRVCALDGARTSLPSAPAEVTTPAEPGCASGNGRSQARGDAAARLGKPGEEAP